MAHSMADRRDLSAKYIAGVEGMQSFHVFGWWDGVGWGGMIPLLLLFGSGVNWR